MTSKEIKKMNRKELRALLQQQEKDNAVLRAEVERLQALYDDRQIQILNSGTMAEAALKLNEVFEAADAACSQYIVNMRDCDAICRQKFEAAEREATEIVVKARTEAESYWTDVEERLRRFCSEHENLQEMINKTFER